jgi:hypothetical protein
VVDPTALHALFSWEGETSRSSVLAHVFRGFRGICVQLQIISTYIELD